MTGKRLVLVADDLRLAQAIQICIEDALGRGALLSRSDAVAEQLCPLLDRPVLAALPGSAPGDALTRLVQTLSLQRFPPNVGGWPGGRSWISTRSAIGRFNYAAALLNGESVGRSEALDVLRLAQRHGRGNDLESIVGFYADLLLGYQPEVAWREDLLAALGKDPKTDPATARRAVTLIQASPEAQLS